MKKRIVLSLLVILILSGCGKAVTEKQSKEIENVEMQDGNETKKEEKNTSDKSTNKVVNTPSESTSKAAKENDLQFETVNYGDTISTDFVEMTIESIQNAEALYPTDTSGVYSYMSDQDGEKYFYLKGSLKNIGGNAYSSENIVAEICFDDKYNYRAYLKADDGGNDFYGDYVKPFGSIIYYIYASIPDELLDSYSECTIKFGFKENFKGSYYDDFEECDYLYQITASK